MIAYRYATAAALLVGATHAHAADLITYTDAAPLAGNAGNLGDFSVNWAVQWSQSVASANVSVSAMLSSSAGPVPANWYITTALGPSATLADVIASGTYVAPQLTFAQFLDYSTAPITSLATGLNFAPGTYYLVLDGPTGIAGNSGALVGGAASNFLASGFTLGSQFFTLSPADFAPSATYEAAAAPIFAFGLESVDGAVPEPATWAMMLAGFGMVGGAMRRRQKVSVRYA